MVEVEQAEVEVREVGVEERGLEFNKGEFQDQVGCGSGVGWRFGGDGEIGASGGVGVGGLFFAGFFFVLVAVASTIRNPLLLL